MSVPEVELSLSCPFADNPAQQQPDNQNREHLLNWYIRSGFRGCLFNKVAARDALRGEYPWIVETEESPIEAITNGDAGRNVLTKFDEILEGSDEPALVSYIFPSLRDPESYLSLLMYLHNEDPARFLILPPEDRAKTSMEDQEDSVGVQFRIKLGETDTGEDVTAYPMIYTPDLFTTFARRYDHFMITFNRFNSKQNPETPDTFIGVDDINLGLPTSRFDHLYQRSLEVRDQAHAVALSDSDSVSNRNLFRAHNALVIPASVWDKLAPNM